MKPTARAMTVATFGLMALLAISSSSVHRQSRARLQTLAKAGNAVETVPKSQPPATAFRAAQELAVKQESKLAAEASAGVKVSPGAASLDTKEEEPTASEAPAPDATAAQDAQRIDVYVHVNVHNDEAQSKAALKAEPAKVEKPEAEAAKAEEKPAAETAKAEEKPAAETAKAEEKPAAETAKAEVKPAAETKLAVNPEVVAKGTSFGTFITALALTGAAVLAVVQARKQGQLPAGMEDQIDSLLGRDSAYTRV